jgi:hypothetical protein
MCMCLFVCMCVCVYIYICVCVCVCVCVYIYIYNIMEHIMKNYPITGFDRPLGLQELEAPRISRQHMRVVRLSALCAGHFYPPGEISGTHVCYRLNRLLGYNAAGRMKSMKIPMTPSGFEPTYFRLVVQWPNQLFHRVPHIVKLWNRILKWVYVCVFVWMWTGFSSK